MESINDLIIDSIKDLKGKNIISLDMRDISGSPADFFIICEGDSTTHVSSIAGNVYKRMKQEMKTLPISYEGKNNSTWMLIDYFTTVVHVFYPETRKFYNLESLWNDAKTEIFGEE
ncbi:MAG TPA: ribosome silencing factor [Bacteroidetes bacterium]|nr:ribosome silencing factor [Bacteroidota bacterium]